MVRLLPFALLVPIALGLQSILSFFLLGFFDGAAFVVSASACAVLSVLSLHTAIRGDTFSSGTPPPPSS